MKIKAILGLVLGALAAGVAAAGGLEMSAYWQNHMVLQRGKPITVWGKDAAGRAVTVSFAGQTANATTGSDGFWETTFAQPFALSATPQTLTISNDVNEVLSISDILVGDVFLAAGQSNMDRRLEDLPEPQSIKDFCRDDDGIRFIRIARSCENSGAGEELFDLPPHKAVDVIANPQYHGMGHDWSPATGDDRNYVSSVALNFAHYIRRSNEEKGQNIPIGIIHASSGGTAIRWWLSNATLSANNLSYVFNDALYWNVMMAPILRAKFRAILWYQGCSDGHRGADEYKALMDILVKDRRDRWGENGDLPFYAVQIASAGYYPPNLDSIDHYPAPTENPYESNYVRIREAQRLWDLSDTGTHGLVTIVDCVKCLGAGDLHPVDKNFVGRRLSLLARRDLYGETSLQAEGPVYTRAVREANGAVRIFFKSGTAKGLTAGRMKPATSVAVSLWVKKTSDPIRGFALGDGNGNWADAEATVEGETIVLRAEGIASPAKFHYGYWSTTRITEMEDGQRLNLYNEVGLPMSPVAPQTIENPNSSAKVVDPVLLPASCYFSPSTNVTISCVTSGATIRYTLDGSDPATTSAIYSAPIAISTTTTVKARAFATNKDPSDIVFATYTLGELPAPEPNPLWTNGAYDPSAWAPLGENLLASATASHTEKLSGYASLDMAYLTDGTIPVSFTTNEVVGLGDLETIWLFNEPKSIGKIRISSRWSDQTYAKIGVNDVYVLKDGGWVALGVPNSHSTGVSTIPPGSLTATLEDEGLGYLAQNVSGLKIAFNRAGANIAQYYGEIEAIAPGVEPPPPLPSVATPAFAPASCNFYPSTNVTLSCATEGATIRYTLDGSNPTSSSAEYTAPIALSATTTVKARAYATDMSPSAVASATYTYTEPGTPGPHGDPQVTTNGMWATSEFSPSAWSPLEDNLLNGLTGTTSGFISGYGGGAGLLTDGVISGETAQTCGFGENATVAWTFDGPKTLEKIRFTSCYIAGSGIYDDIKISKVEVKTSGSDSWTDLGVEAVNYAGTGTAGTALSATVEDVDAGFLAQNVTALRITFGKQNNVAQYYAEIEAVGTAAGVAPVETVVDPTFSPASCNFYPSTNVTLSCATEGATIRYTLDGSDPTSESAEYTASIALSATTTIKARAFAADMNPSAIVSATYSYTEPETPGPHVDPPNPGGESARTWTAGDYDPSTWTQLEDNILAGVTAQEVSNPSKISFAASKNLSKLTDGAVSATADSNEIVGLCPGAELVWTFSEPKVLEEIRFSSLWSSRIYAGISVSNILVKTSASPDWVSLDVNFSRSGNASSAGAQYALLSDPGLGYLALDVVALKFVSGNVEAFANYYAEIEAVGRTGGVAYPPALSGLKVKPWGTSAEFSGSVASVGTGASSCDVYLAYGPDADHLGSPVKIYSGNAGAFHYELEGLAMNTAYSYQIAVSNNAATVMGCEVAGSFSTTGEVHPDWSGYKWAVIGDSLTDPTLEPGAENYYYSFVARDTGIQLVYTNGVGSTGYKNKSNEERSFYQRLQASPLPSDVDVVTIFGSVNDWGLVRAAADAGEPTDGIDDGKTTLAAYMNKAIDVVQAQAPNARLVLVGSLYYYNVVTEAHVRANETLRAVAAQRGIAFYDWLTENANDPLDFHHIADNPTEEGSFAQRYTRDCPAEIIPGETSFGHPSAEYHEVWLSPHFRGVLTAALAGLSEPPSEPPSVDKMFYVGETGYDSWADAYAAAANGDTIVVGTNAVFAMSGNKQITIDLAGRDLEWEGTGWMSGKLNVVDTVGEGSLKLSGYSRNVGGGTVNISSLSESQLTGFGIFWTNPSTVLMFPGDMALANCTSRIGNPQNGLTIAVQGVTYVYDGSSWISQGASYPEWAGAMSLTGTQKYNTWATKYAVSDSTAAMREAYLLNCANTADAVAAAKAAFKPTSITINADGTVDVGLPAAPDGGFNGTVTVLGCETIDGEYHALTDGTFHDSLYSVPAGSNDRFFKAALDL